MSRPLDRLLESAPVGNAWDESAFFAGLKMPNGTFKLTMPSRFAEWDAVLRPFLQQRAAAIRQVLDLGASTGVTTVELHRLLGASGVEARVTATDLYVEAFLVTFGPRLRALCDRHGSPLKYEVFGLAVRPWSRRLDYVTSAWLPLALARRLLRPRLAAAVRSGNAAPVRMITGLLRRGDPIEVVENDIMAHTPAFAGRFDLVRAANLLNLNYFGVEQIRAALSNVRSYMSGPGSLLLVTRTNLKGRNDGTLFELADDRRFRVLTRVGRGSEIESIVAEMDQAPCHHSGNAAALA
jgi:hypothetical protein